jgi:hypothetical protein
MWKVSQMLRSAVNAALPGASGRRCPSVLPLAIQGEWVKALAIKWTDFKNNEDGQRRRKQMRAKLKDPNKRAASEHRILTPPCFVPSAVQDATPDRAC